MKIFDLIKLAAKNLRGWWAALIVLGMAFATFCLCFAGAILTSVQQEKSLPYELIVSSEGNTTLSDSQVAEITKTDGVLAVTPVYQVPVTIKTGEYMAQLTLTGINPAYLTEPYSQGSGFPESSVMPYIVLNLAAQKQFSKDKTGSNSTDTGSQDTGADEANTGSSNATNNSSDAKVPEIDWLNASYTVHVGEESKGLTSKVCGILAIDDEKEEQEPAAYISLSAAKSLMQKSGQAADYSAIHVRVENIGQADGVSKSLAALGLTVTNSTEELQAGWNALSREMAFLLVIAVFCLISAAIAMTAWRQISLTKQKQEWNMLQLIGMCSKDIGRLFAIQSVLGTVLGVAIGVIIAVSLPSFLAAEEETTFKFAVPLLPVLISAGICLAAGMLPSAFTFKRGILWEKT